MHRVLGEWGIPGNNGAGRRQQEMCKENPEWKPLRRTWCWGPNDFREELLERITQKKGEEHHGEELRKLDEQKTRRLIE